MTSFLTVEHQTVYRYRRAVAFGDHRMMFRPRDSHDLRLLSTALVIEPRARVRWLHDVFGNSVGIASFSDEADTLLFRSTFRARHYPVPPDAITLEPQAQDFPFAYSDEEVADLGRRLARHYPDPDDRVEQWAQSFAGLGRSDGTFPMLREMNRAIRADFDYRRREERGTQAPVTTLERRSGTCRDFAVLMMEAARSLGLAAQFVTGYLYDEKLLGAGEGLVGGGATHAWCQIFLPGAGWVEFDPTNALVGGRNLIRIGVARAASQAIPLSGGFRGTKDDFIDMSVAVRVTSE